MARFAALVVTVAVLGVSYGVGADAGDLPGAGARSAAVLSADLPAIRVARVIDERIDARLATAGIPASAAAADAEFLRRVYLDLHGVVPAADRVLRFLEDDTADKRSKLIDELLGDPRFAAHLADVWDDYLIPAAADPRSGKPRLTEWLEEAFRTKSWDRIARELLTASGHWDENAAVTYLLKGRQTLSPAEMTDLVSQYFLGVRLNCAQCHDHPFASWTQSDYWGVAAFFTQIQYTDRRQLKSGMIRDDPAVDVSKLEDAAKLRTPRFLDGPAPQSGRDVPHRQALARWITSPDNPYFARAMVNRMWSQFFGRGLVEPVDDMHEGNPATHPELLDELTERFVASGFDLRHLCRAITSSATYQRTSMRAPGNEQDATLYSRMAVKVLTPEQLYDSLSVVMPATSGRKRFGGNNDPREEFVQFFRSEGEPKATAYDRGIPQTLRMMNSPELFSPRSASAAVRRIEPGMPASEAVERLYLHALARRPTDDERRILDNFLTRHPGEREQAYAEILWSLINSSEFSLNH
jgi:hypothetical protein